MPKISNKISNIVGEGSFGCVLKPSLLCADKKISYKNKISKLMLTKDAIEELKEYVLISKVDKQQKYYLGVPTKCKVKKTMNAFRSIRKCNITKKYLKTYDDLDRFSLLVSPDGGINLKMLAKKIDGMRVTPANIQFVKHFWKEMHRLFKGLIIFHKHSILHHDLKPQNIVYDMENHRANFIDFGHMRNVATEIKKVVESDNWIYEYAFWNYPLEIQFLNQSVYMDFVGKSEKEREVVFDEIVKNVAESADEPFANAFYILMDYILSKNATERTKQEVIQKYLTDFHMLLKSLHANNYMRFVERSIQTVDVYGLGLSMKYMLNHTKRFLSKEVVKNLDDCFAYMTTADLSNRYTITEAETAFRVSGVFTSAADAAAAAIHTNSAAKLN